MFRNKNSDYYKDLLLKGETLVGKGLITNIIDSLCELSHEELVDVLSYIEQLKIERC